MKKFFPGAIYAILLVITVSVVLGVFHYSKDISIETDDKEPKIAVTNDSLAIFTDNTVIDLNTTEPEYNRVVLDNGILISSYHSDSEKKLTYYDKNGSHLISTNYDRNATSFDGSVIHFTEIINNVCKMYNYYTDKNELVEVGKITPDPGQRVNVDIYSCVDGSISCWIDRESNKAYICDEDIVAGKISKNNDIYILGISSKDKSIYYYLVDEAFYMYSLEEKQSNLICRKNFGPWFYSNANEEMLMFSKDLRELMYLSEGTDMVYGNMNMNHLENVKMIGERNYNNYAGGVLVDVGDNGYNTYYYLNDDISLNEICKAGQGVNVIFDGSTVIYVRDGELYCCGIDNYTRFSDDKGFRKFVRFFYDFNYVRHQKISEQEIPHSGSDIIDIRLSNDGKYIYYRTDENELWKVDLKGQSKQIANDVVSFEVGAEKSLYFKIGVSDEAAGTLFEYSGGKSKQISESDGITDLIRSGNRVMYVDISGTQLRYNFDGRVIGSTYYIENKNGKFEAVFKPE